MPSTIADAAFPWLSLAVGLSVGLALGARLMDLVRTRREQSLARARNARGRRGEERAAQLLTAAGYEIVSRQQRASYAVREDGATRRVSLSFDFVVERAGKRSVAEVKTGAGTQLKHADTRRQLLEYQLASECEQVLLVDPELERICLVSFPLGSAHEPNAEPSDARSRTTWPVWLCMAIAAVCVYLWSR